MAKNIGIYLIFSVLVLARISVAHADDNQDAPNPYGTNMLRLTPLTATDIGVGFGLSYEKIIADGMFGIVFPVNLIFENKEDYKSMIYPGNDETRFNMYAYFMPGLKVYPLGQRKITYSIGPSLLLAYGGGNEWQYHTDNLVSYVEEVKTTRLRLGMLVNNYLGFQFTPMLNLGIEGGLGARYYERETVSGPEFYPGNGTFTKGFDITGQFSLTLGIRF